MTYEDTVLVKLRRVYKKDEVVMFSLNKIKEQQIEIGKLKSYIDELEDKLLKKNKQISKEVDLKNDTKLLLSKINSLRDKLFNILTNPEKFNKKTLEEKIEYLDNFI